MLDLLDEEVGIELFSARRSALMLEAGPQIYLATDRPVPDGLVADIRRAVQRVMGDDIPVRVIAFLIAQGSPLEPVVPEEITAEEEG